jgi:hypothetical protein
MPGVSAKAAKAMILALPGVELGTAYGGPAYRLRGKLFAGFLDGDSALGIRMPFDERDMRIEMAPEIYFTTDHHRSHPGVLIRLAAIGRSELGLRLEESWRRAATKAMVKAFDAARAN